MYRKMNKIDERIRKIIKGKKNLNSFNKSYKNILSNKNNILFKDLFKNKKSSFFNMTKLKPASLKMQKRWSDFPKFKKQYLRKILVDTDKDLIPDKYDCQPYNRKKQDSPTMELYQKWLKKAGTLKKQIESLGYPVTLVGVKKTPPNEEFNYFIEYLENLNPEMPVDVYAKIPINSNLHKLIKKNNIKDVNIKNSKLRYESNYGWFIEGGDLFNEWGYTGYVLVDQNNYVVNDINAPNNPNLKIVEFERAIRRGN